MPFNAGELVATIRLDGVDKFQGDIQSSGKQFETLGNVGRAALDVVAASTTAAAAAATTYLGILFNTGVAYNTLQQTTRAALTTLLGGAQAANEQMDKLDAFARTSPFSKQVFITAQQQLIGFGVSASQVIPILQSVQDAVAATGGSSAQLGSIVTILSQIHAAGKITGEDLLQLGQYGIDAATIIGAQMGKTGAQIRDDITNGALDANVAISALTTGMEQRFAGAAANVKNTFSGTVDRIKAASRDIGSALAEPFVSTNGGGLFILWGNQVADILRAVQSKTGDVVDTLEGRAAPAFAEITELLDKAVVAVKSWDASRLESTLDKLEPYVPIVTGFAAAWAVVGLQAVPVLGALLGGLSPLTAGLLAMSAASPVVRSALSDVISALRPLIPVATQVANELTNVGLDVLATGLRIVAAVLGPVADMISNIPTPLLAAVVAFVALRSALGPLEEPLAKVVAGLASIVAQAVATSAMAGMSGAAGVLGTTMAAGAIGVDAMGTALKAAFLSNPIGIALTVIAAGAALLAGALSAQKQKAEDDAKAISNLKATLTATGDATTATTAKLKEFFDSKDNGVADELKQVGISSSLVAQAIQAGGLQLNALRDSIKLTAQEAQELAKIGSSSGPGNNANAAVTAELKSELQGRQDLLAKIDEQVKALADAKTAQEAEEAAIRKANASMTDAERAAQKFDDALAIVNDTSKTSTERINALEQAVNLLKGGTMTAKEQADELNKTIISLSDAFSQTGADGKKLWKSLLDGAGNVNTASSAGQNLNDTLKDQRTKMEQAMLSARDLAKQQGGDSVAQATAATAAGQKYVDALRDTAKQAGLTDGQIQGLITTYADVPTTTRALITDSGTIGATQLQLISLTAQINSTPNHTVVIDDPHSAKITAALKDMGITITTLPSGKIRLDGSAVDDINGKLDNALTKLSYIGGMSANKIKMLTNQLDANYDGGMYLQGVKAFADGGFPSGIYAGVQGGIHKFAEKEMGVPWEAYISGRPSAAERNRQILAKTAGLLQMQVVPVGAARPFATGALLGATPTTVKPAPHSSSPQPGDVWNFTYVKQGDDGLTDLQELVQAGQVMKAVTKKR